MVGNIELAHGEEFVGDGWSDVCDRVGGRDSVACILCIDDNQDVLESLGGLLRTSGYRTLTALSGMQEILLSLQNSVDLVVLDYEMPGMNGDLVAQAIRRSKPELPIILFTGRPDNVADIVRQNVNGVVNKADLGGLLAIVSKLIKKSPGKREAT
jgi:CheY-like chemotaxis protein